MRTAYPTPVARRLGAGLLLLATSACYTRAVIPPRATEPKARVAMAFAVEPSLVEQARQDAMEPLPGEDPEVNRSRQAAMAQALGQDLALQLRADLVEKRIAVPVATEDEADLLLSGSFRPGATGVELAWHAVDRESGATVAAGLESVGLFGSVAPFADAVLTKLSQMDLDRYASKPAAAPASTTAAPPAGEPPASATDGSRAFAVVIGVSRYREALPEATHAEDDARAFAAYARTTLGVPPEHVKLLVGERAGRADVASAIEEWLPRNAREPGGTVYVFFSGHGAPDPETGRAYLVPWDGDPAYLRTRGIELDDLYAKLAALTGQRVYAFLDACFSGGGERSVLPAGTRPLVPVKEAQAPAGLVAFSAAGARETTGASASGDHGLFTHHLLAAIAGAADANADRDVTLAELVAHVTSKVEAEARLANRDQRPHLAAPAGMDPATLVLVKGLR